MAMPAENTSIINNIVYRYITNFKEIIFKPLKSLDKFNIDINLATKLQPVNVFQIIAYQFLVPCIGL